VFAKDTIPDRIAIGYAPRPLIVVKQDRSGYHDVPERHRSMNRAARRRRWWWHPIMFFIMALGLPLLYFAPGFSAVATPVAMLPWCIRWAD
jgi:hypothetical protein